MIFYSVKINALWWTHSVTVISCHERWLCYICDGSRSLQSHFTQSVCPQVWTDGSAPCWRVLVPSSWWTDRGGAWLRRYRSDTWNLKYATSKVRMMSLLWDRRKTAVRKKIFDLWCALVLSFSVRVLLSFTVAPSDTREYLVQTDGWRCFDVTALCEGLAGRDVT